MYLSSVAGLGVVMISGIRAAVRANGRFLRVVLRAFREFRLSKVGRSAIASRTRLIQALSLAFACRAPNGHARFHSLRSLGRFRIHDSLFLSFQ